MKKGEVKYYINHCNLVNPGPFYFLVSPVPPTPKSKRIWMERILDLASPKLHLKYCYDLNRLFKNVKCSMVNDHIIDNQSLKKICQRMQIWTLFIVKLFKEKFYFSKCKLTVFSSAPLLLSLLQSSEHQYV